MNIQYFFSNVKPCVFKTLAAEIYALPVMLLKHLYAHLSIAFFNTRIFYIDTNQKSFIMRVGA